MPAGPRYRSFFSALSYTLFFGMYFLTNVLKVCPWYVRHGLAPQVLHGRCASQRNVPCAAAVMAVLVVECTRVVAAHAKIVEAADLLAGRPGTRLVLERVQPERRVERRLHVGGRRVGLSRGQAWGRLRCGGRRDDSLCRRIEVRCWHRRCLRWCSRSHRHRRRHRRHRRCLRCRRRRRRLSPLQMCEHLGPRASAARALCRRCNGRMHLATLDNDDPGRATLE